MQRKQNKRHPDTEILSENTGHTRNYNRSPYRGYKNSRELYFPVAHHDDRYHPKEQVIGVSLQGQFKAYPFSELRKTRGPFFDHLAGIKIEIIFDRAHHSARVFKNGDEIPSVLAYWFAWAAFHPETAVYRAGVGGR